MIRTIVFEADGESQEGRKDGHAIHGSCGALRDYIGDLRGGQSCIVW
jgi:hypothetical protein